MPDVPPDVPLQFSVGSFVIWECFTHYLMKLTERLGCRVIGPPLLKLGTKKITLPRKKNYPPQLSLIRFAKGRKPNRRWQLCPYVHACALVAREKSSVKVAQWRTGALLEHISGELCAHQPRAFILTVLTDSPTTTSALSGLYGGASADTSMQINKLK